MDSGEKISTSIKEKEGLGVVHNLRSLVRRRVRSGEGKGGTAREKRQKASPRR